MPHAFCTPDKMHPHGAVMMPGFRQARGENPCILFLFDGWVLDTATKYSFAVLGAFMMAVSIQFIMSLRKNVSSSKPADEQQLLSGAAQQMRVPKVLVLEALLYGLQMTFAYWLMLLTMTYESVIFTAIILGLTTGHLLNGFRSSTASRGVPHEQLSTVEPSESGVSPCCAAD